MEFIELPRGRHPFFVGTQAHPEFKSRPTRPHPLFRGLVAAAVEHRMGTRLPVEEAPESGESADSAIAEDRGQREVAS